MRLTRFTALLVLALLASGCAERQPTQPPQHHPDTGTLHPERQGLLLRAHASWAAHGNGETHDQNALVAAHRSLPFGTRVRVTNQQNGKQVVVRINDRGPFRRGRIIDVSAPRLRSWTCWTAAWSAYVSKPFHE